MSKVISQFAFPIVFTLMIAACGTTGSSNSKPSTTQYIEIYDANGNTQEIMVSSGVSDVTYSGNQEARIVLNDGRQFLDHNAYPHKYDYLLKGKATPNEPGP